MHFGRDWATVSSKYDTEWAPGRNCSLVFQHILEPLHTQRGTMLMRIKLGTELPVATPRSEKLTSWRDGCRGMSILAWGRLGYRPMVGMDPRCRHEQRIRSNEYLVVGRPNSIVSLWQENANSAHHGLSVLITRSETRPGNKPFVEFSYT